MPDFFALQQLQHKRLKQVAICPSVNRLKPDFRISSEALAKPHALIYDSQAEFAATRIRHSITA